MNSLQTLAELAGISSSYIDKTGNIHHTDDCSRNLFLTSMGYKVQNQAEIEQEIQKLQTQSPLPDVLSFFDDEPIEFEIRVKGTYTLIISDEQGKICWQNEVNGLEKITISGIKLGYYKIQLKNSQIKQQCFLIYAPKYAYKAPFILKQKHIYGTAVMLYALRSEHSLGIGDFGDLIEIVKATAKLGGDIVGINPLGVMSPFTQNEERLNTFVDISHKKQLSDVSPYRTLSRFFINYIYIDLTQVKEYQSSRVQAFIQQKQIQQEIRSLNENDFVQYARVLELKRRILELMFEEFNENISKNEHQKFQIYQEEKGEKLDNLALFETILETVTPCDYWRNFPNNYNKIDSDETAVFRKLHKKRIMFYKYCHWLADTQLAQVQNLAKKLKMKVGLYTDMPIGAASNGVEVWSNPQAFVLDADIGAPADPMRPRGQSWGFTPYHPIILEKQHYEPFISLVRENMRHSGALRIDHAMGLKRLFWGYFTPNIPSVQGAYVYYNMKDMVAILTLESHRAKCMVICEDLGTVPEGFREYMKEHALFSYKVTARQKEKDGTFISPNNYDYLSLAQFSTHDQATSCGFWKNEDIEIFQKSGLYINNKQYLENLHGREKDRYNLISALKNQNLITAAQEKSMQQSAPKGNTIPQNIQVLFNQYTAKTNSAIFLIRLNDVYKQVVMDNVPGTVKEYPNWRIKMNISSDRIITSQAFIDIMKVIQKTRPE